MGTLAYAALWCFVFSVPWDNLLTINGVNVASRASGVLAMGLTLVTVLTSGRFRRWHGLHIAAALFVISAGCGLLVTQQQIPNKLWTYSQLFLVLWMMWEVAPSRQRQLGLLAAYVFGAYVSALGTIMAFLRQGGMMRRFSAGGVDANDLAMTLALALPMAWYLGMTHRRPLVRWIGRAYLPVGLFAIGLSGSRGGMLATMVALLIVPLTMTKLTPGRLAMAVVILGISGFLAVSYVPETVVKRLATTSTEIEDLSLGGRFRVWKAGMKAFAKEPLIGYGTASFKYAVGAGKVAHNSYVSVLVEQGLVGFILYSLMFVSVFLAVLDLPLLDRRFALVLLATLAVVMFPLTWEDRKPVWFVLAALLGLARAKVTETGGAVQPARSPLNPQFARPALGTRPLEPMTAPRRRADPDVPA